MTNIAKIEGKTLTAQLADFKSHNRIVLSREPDRKISSTGDIDKVITLARESPQFICNITLFVLLFHMTGKISNVFIIM